MQWFTGQTLLLAIAIWAVLFQTWRLSCYRHSLKKAIKELHQLNLENIELRTESHRRYDRDRRMGVVN